MTTSTLTADTTIARLDAAIARLKAARERGPLSYRQEERLTALLFERNAIA